MAMVGEKAFEVYEILAVFILFKSDGFDKAFCLLVGNFANEARAMYSAQVYKIERSSAEHEESLEVKGVRGGSDIINYSALVGQLELAYAHKDVVDGCRIRKQVGLENNVTFFADLFLLCLALNGRLSITHLIKSRILLGFGF
ncbi:MAG: hypothetical protein J6V46_05185 [Methanobrevibacter sp.]|nr:hypothetical protein [Methanobrevibacter sp.]